MFLGSPFSTTFAQIVLAIDAVIISAVVIGIGFGRIAGACAAALERLSLALVHLVAQWNPRRR